MAQQLGAHHGRQRQRHDHRDDDGDGERDRELAEHAPDETAHEQQRDEHSEQRRGERDDREADLRRASAGGGLAILAELAVAGDVLDHDDGVIDHETRRDRQRHQREIVEAEPEGPHQCE